MTIPLSKYTSLEESSSNDAVSDLNAPEVCNIFALSAAIQCLDLQNNPVVDEEDDVEEDDVEEDEDEEIVEQYNEDCLKDSDFQCAMNNNTQGYCVVS